MPDDSRDLEKERLRLTAQRLIFEQLIEAAKVIDRAITGLTDVPDQQHVGAVLFLNALTQALSFLKIAPNPTEDKQLYDVASCASLIRLIAETYLTFRYISVDPENLSDYLFRLNISEFHRRYKTEKMMSNFGQSKDTLELAKQKLIDAKQKLELDSLFNLLSEGQKKSLLQGEKSKHIGLAAIAEKSGLSSSAWAATYTYLSQFAHSSPMAILHLRSFNANTPQANSTFSLLFQLASGFIAKLIQDMEQLFPRSGALLTYKQRESILVGVKVLNGFGRTALE